MQIVKTIKQSLLNMILFTLILGVYSLNAQVINYNEVNAYGWGQGMDMGAPALCDIDNDGYMDMLLGNLEGKIWHLEQAGGDEFIIVSKNFCGIDVGTSSIPVFTNINNNGLIDLVIGSKENLEWYEQADINSNSFVLKSSSLISVDIGRAYAPTIADLNHDGLLEMFIGEFNGYLWYFEQDSINAGTFSLVDDSWMDWDVGMEPRPHFTDLNDDGLFDLLIGEPSGKIIHLVQNGVDSINFHQVSDNLIGMEFGSNLIPCVVDIDNDHKMDLFIGELFNGLYHYEQADSASDEFILISDQVYNTRDFGFYIGFTIEDIDGDGLLDMLVSPLRSNEETNYIEHYEQDEIGSLNFILIDNQFNDITNYHYYNLSFYDINGNGLLDLFVGKKDGTIARYEQDEPNSYNFSLEEDEFSNIDLNSSAHPTFRDIDGDSDLEMIAGSVNNTLYYFNQDSIDDATFKLQTTYFLFIELEGYLTPEFTDIDGDSLLDLIVGDKSGRLHYYEQDAVHSSDFSLITDNFASIDYGTRVIPRFADVNNDGQLDMFVAENGGGITLHLRNDENDMTPPDVPTNLSAVVDGNYVNLSWSACTAEDLALYNIYRGVRNDTTVAEYINSAKKGVTIFADSSLTVSGTYFYWVKALDTYGNESGFSNADSMSITIVGIKDIQESILNDFALYQNYPNPFNPETTIRYTVRAQDLVPQRVELSIYNTLGQKVATLVNKKQPAGSYQVKWNASGLSSGVYLYHLQAGEHVQTKKMILMK